MGMQRCTGECWSFQSWNLHGCGGLHRGCGLPGGLRGLPGCFGGCRVGACGSPGSRPLAPSGMEMMQVTDTQERLSTHHRPATKHQSARPEHGTSARQPNATYPHAPSAHSGYKPTTTNLHATNTHHEPTSQPQPCLCGGDADLLRHAGSRDRRQAEGHERTKPWLWGLGLGVLVRSWVAGLWVGGFSTPHQVLGFWGGCRFGVWAWGGGPGQRAGGWAGGLCFAG